MFMYCLFPLPSFFKDTFTGRSVLGFLSVPVGKCCPRRFLSPQLVTGSPQPFGPSFLTRWLALVGDLSLLPSRGCDRLHAGLSLRLGSLSEISVHPGRVAQVVGASSRKPKCHRFDSRSQGACWARRFGPESGRVREAPDGCFSPHRCFSLPPKSGSPSSGEH